MTIKKNKHILVLHDHRRRGMVLTDEQHLKAIEQNAEIANDVSYLNFSSLAPDSGMDDPIALPPTEIFETRFDAVILHYSFLSLRTTGKIFYKWRQAVDWIKKIDCPKIAIPQDEMDHAGLLDDWLFELETDAVFSVHYKPEGPLYPRTRTRAVIVNCLPGYINETTAHEIAPILKPHSQRHLDIVYRANHLPYWYGSHCQLKHLIGQEVQKRAPAHDLKTDISTEAYKVIEGGDWLRFLASSRFSIGGEGGRTVVDYCGEKRLLVDLLLRDNPGATFADISKLMPAGWDSDRMLTITPRHFEAIITKTAQLLVRGEYKGVLEPDKHYIPFKEDFSDLHLSLEKIKDVRYCENLAECAYEEIYRSGRYSYKLFAKRILDQIDDLQTSYRNINAMKNPDDQKQNPAVEAIERELSAIRYQNILLHAQLEHAQAIIQDTKSELSLVRNELQSVLSDYQFLSKTMRERIPASRIGIKISHLIRKVELRPYLFLGGFMAAIIIVIMINWIF